MIDSVELALTINSQDCNCSQETLRRVSQEAVSAIAADETAQRLLASLRGKISDIIREVEGRFAVSVPVNRCRKAPHRQRGRARE